MVMNGKCRKFTLKKNKLSYVINAFLVFSLACLPVSAFAEATNNYTGDYDGNDDSITVKGQDESTNAGPVEATGSSELPEQAQEGAAKPVLRCYGSGAAEGVVFEGSDLDPSRYDSCEVMPGQPQGEGAPVQAKPFVVTREQVAKLFVKGSGVERYPAGRTLVIDHDITFWTSRNKQSITSNLLGRQVEIEASPVKYIWDFGDGVIQETDYPGSPPPVGGIVHQFKDTGNNFRVQLTVVWVARWRLAGGAWQTVRGTITTHEFSTYFDLYLPDSYGVVPDYEPSPTIEPPVDKPR